MDNQQQNDEVQKSKIESTESKSVNQQQHGIEVEQEHQRLESEPCLEELRQRVLEQRGSRTVLPDGWENDSNQIDVEQEIQDELVVVESEDGNGNQNDKIQQEKSTFIDETVTPQLSHEVERQNEDTQDPSQTPVQPSEQGSTRDQQLLQVQHQPIQVDSIPSTSTPTQNDSEKTSDQKIDEKAKNKEVSAVEQEVVPDGFSANDDPEAKAMLERALTSLSNIDSISTNSKGKSKAIEKDDDVSSDSDSDSSISSSSSSSSSSSDSDSDSDSDSSSTKNPQILPEDFDSDLDSDSDNPRKNKKKSGTNQEEGETEIQTGPITANEIVPKLSVPKIKVLEPEVEIRYLGKVHSIVDSVVVVEQDVVKKSNGENGGAKRRNWNEMDQRPIDRFGKKGEEVDQYSVLDTDSLLALEDRTVVGLIYETFGSILSPLYSIRFPSSSSIPSTLTIGTLIYYSPSQSTYVMTRALQHPSMKGSDASNIFDEEVGDDEREFSDDEMEAEIKRSKKKGKKDKKRKAREGGEAQDQTEGNPRANGRGGLNATSRGRGGSRGRGNSNRGGGNIGTSMGPRGTASLPPRPRFDLDDPQNLNRPTPLPYEDYSSNSNANGNSGGGLNYGESDQDDVKRGSKSQPKVPKYDHQPSSNLPTQLEPIHYSAKLEPSSQHSSNSNSPIIGGHYQLQNQYPNQQASSSSSNSFHHSLPSNPNLSQQPIPHINPLFFNQNTWNGIPFNMQQNMNGWNPNQGYSPQQPQQQQFPPNPYGNGNFHPYSNQQQSYPNQYQPSPSVDNQNYLNPYTNQQPNPMMNPYYNTAYQNPHLNNNNSNVDPSNQYNPSNPASYNPNQRQQ